MIKIVNLLLESSNWYHGTPDSREVEKLGGFDSRVMKVKYVSDLDRYNQLQLDMQDANTSNDSTKYINLVRELESLIKEFKYNKPIFLSDSYKVAKTYADPKRAFDYQDATQKVFEVEVNCNKVVRIDVPGEQFRFLSIDKIVKSFVSAGSPMDKVVELISMFNYYNKDAQGIQTDVVAAMGNWFGYDCIDVVGVLDSYMGGTDRSIVRMVLNPSDVRIIKK